MCDVYRQQHVSLCGGPWAGGGEGAGVANDVSSPPPQTVGVCREISRAELGELVRSSEMSLHASPPHHSLLKTIIISVCFGTFLPCQVEHENVVLTV